MSNVVAGAGRLVVGTSGSPGSIHALRYAVDMARRHDIPLLAVLAWVPPSGDLTERRHPLPELRPTWADAARKRLGDALGAACGGVPSHVDIKLCVVRGAPGWWLVDVADSADDVLVVGAGRRTTLSRMWRGKVTRYCLAHARCPVLAVPHPATAKELGLGRAAWTLRHRELTLERALRDWDAAV